jgi:hypothetical protein
MATSPPPAATDVAADSPAGSTAVHARGDNNHHQRPLQPGDVLKAWDTEGLAVYLEVLSVDDTTQSVIVAWQGIKYAVSNSSSEDASSRVSDGSHESSSAGNGSSGRQRGTLLVPFEPDTASHHHQQQQQAQGRQQLQQPQALQPDNDSGEQQWWVLHPQGLYLGPNDPLVRAMPGWAEARSRDMAQAPQLVTPGNNSSSSSSSSSSPQHASGNEGGSAVMRVHGVARCGSMADLEAAVSANASVWCDGTGPGEAPLVGLDYQLLCAGELMSLLLGKRQVCLVQVHIGWNKGQAAGRQCPVYNPLAAAVLRRVMQSSEFVVFVSALDGE